MEIISYVRNALFKQNMGLIYIYISFNEYMYKFSTRWEVW